MLESFLTKLQAFITATLLKRDSSEICKVFKETLFYWTSPVVVCDSFRFAVCNFIKKEIPAKIFFCEFCKTSFQTSFDRTPPDDYCLSVNFKKFCQNISFIEQLWETSYFMYKLQNFNKQIQWKTISQVLFKHFMEEQEIAVQRRFFT